MIIVSKTSSGIPYVTRKNLVDPIEELRSSHEHLSSEEIEFFTKKIEAIKIEYMRIYGTDLPVKYIDIKKEATIIAIDPRKDNDPQEFTNWDKESQSNTNGRFGYAMHRGSVEVFLHIDRPSHMMNFAKAKVGALKVQ